MTYRPLLAQDQSKPGGKQNGAAASIPTHWLLFISYHHHQDLKGIDCQDLLALNGVEMGQSHFILH